MPLMPSRGRKVKVTYLWHISCASCDKPQIDTILSALLFLYYDPDDRRLVFFLAGFHVLLQLIVGNGGLHSTSYESQSLYCRAGSKICDG